MVKPIASSYRVAAAISVVVLASCTSGNATTPSPPSLALTCQGPIDAQSVDGKPVSVVYASPAVTGGQAPATTTCAPPSGELFSVGSTTVRCSAQDAAKQSASCSFTVKVSKAPQLAVSRFVAFGDSMTAGENPSDCGLSTGTSCKLPLPTFERDLRALAAVGESSPVAYPRQLQQQLSSRFPNQQIVVSNQGLPGETIHDGRSRLPSALTGLPEVLLLLEGANDMNRGFEDRSSNAALVDELRSMVRDARSRGLTVFLATLPPQREGACRAQDFCDQRYDTPDFNRQLRTMAVNERAILVDVYSLFEGKLGTYLGIDGLHPNETGYRAIADAFFAAIQEHFGQ